MKKALIHYIKNEKVDEYRTPEYAIKPLLKYIPENYIIWEPTGINSPITAFFRRHGYEVIETHIEMGFDFLKDEPGFHFDVIVTNPPYSKKTEFLKRAYELGKPFALLLPLAALEGVERGKLFRKYGIELIVFDRRVEFMNKGRVWFPVAWFCWKLLPEKLIFCELKRQMRQKLVNDEANEAKLERWLRW